MHAGPSPKSKSALFKKKQKVCFLFNHDQTHQVAHSLPIAMAMARDKRVDVTIATTNDQITSYVSEVLGPSACEVTCFQLDLNSAISRGVTAFLDGLVPARKLLMYRDNLGFFRQFDALVVSEKSSLLLKKRYGLDGLKLIHTRHGAGDRAIGFNKESSLFDLILVSGPKIARRLQKEAEVPAQKIRIAGYSKFDLFGNTRLHLPFANPALPTIVYNPHVSPRLSSWPAMGERVLRELTGSNRYNVIFAPHVMLFARKFVVTVSPPAISLTRRPSREISKHANLLIDLGSDASTNMAYTNAADIYVGDVSSQVYEFIRKPRPCLHLDAQGVNWQSDPDYSHWRLGPVAGRDQDVLAAVDEAVANHADYLPVQKAMLKDTFSMAEELASDRSAQAIIEFLDAKSH